MSNIEQGISNDEVNSSCSCLRSSIFVIRPARYARKRIWARSLMPMSIRATLTYQSARRAGGYSAVYPPRAGSPLRFSAACVEVTD